MPNQVRIAKEAVGLYRTYGSPGMLRLLVDVFWTKLTFPAARILRRPFYLRGKRWITLGGGFTSGPGLRIDALPQAPHGAETIIRIGEGVQVNDYVHIAGVNSVTIGNRVLIASKVLITDHGHGSTRGCGESPLIPPAGRRLCCAPVVIEDDVWIGEFVSVLQGVTIGKGAIIGTMSTVTRDIPAFSLAVGSPARVIKTYNFQTSCWDSA